MNNLDLYIIKYVTDDDQFTLSLEGCICITNKKVA